MQATVDVPEDTRVEVDGDTIRVSAGDVTVERTFKHPLIKIEVSDDSVTFSTEDTHKRTTAVLNTYRSHLTNMINGAQNPFTYKLRAVYAHFPMQVAVENNQFVVKNFLGERAPRTLPIPADVDVTVDGEDVTVASPDIEKAGNMAARIERLCYINKKDPRKFQDGIYLVEKGQQE